MWRPIASVRRRLGQLGYAVADVFGEHDYDRYLAAWHARDAAERPMTRREFFDWQLEQKYGAGGGNLRRCC